MCIIFFLKKIYIHCVFKFNLNLDKYIKYNTKSMENELYKMKVNNQIEFTCGRVPEGYSVVKLQDNVYHAIVDHRSIKATIVSENFNKRTYKIRIDGRDFEVYIGHHLDKLIEELGLETKEILRIDSLTSPMPGLIIEINVKPGDKVKEGETLLILKAMKMENAITSPIDATIKSVAVKADQTVDKNQLLIEFEKPE